MKNGKISETRAKVVIIQPYVPAYRVSLFDHLQQILEPLGIDIEVIAGEPTGPEAGRADSITGPQWLHFRKARIIKLGRRRLTISTWRESWKHADVVVCPHEGSSLGTNAALILRRRGSHRVLLWGHIASYVGRANPLDALIERLQLKAANGVLAYTQRGADFAIEQGADPAKVTTLNNTIDTNELTKAIADVTTSEMNRFRDETGLIAEKVALYIGALDETKRIDFLVDALDQLWDKDPTIQVIVAGRGSQEHLLARQSLRGQVIMLGRADAAQKATAATIAGCILCPGRIGLVAVDSLVMGLPVLSTEWPFHAPERDYLVQGKNLFVVGENDTSGYADLIVDACTGLRTILEKNRAPRIEDMAERFALAIRRSLGQS